MKISRRETVTDEILPLLHCNCYSQSCFCFYNTVFVDPDNALNYIAGDVARLLPLDRTQLNTFFLDLTSATST